MDHLLAVSKLNKSFKIGNQKLHVLRDVELSLNPGELVALMGPSGSVKST